MREHNYLLSCLPVFYWLKHLDVCSYNIIVRYKFDQCYMFTRLHPRSVATSAVFYIFLLGSQESGFFASSDSKVIRIHHRLQDAKQGVAFFDFFAKEIAFRYNFSFVAIPSVRWDYNFDDRLLLFPPLTM